MSDLPLVQRRSSAGPPPIFGKVGIVGLGLIGGSIALAVRELWPSAQIVAVDRKDVLAAATRVQAIDHGADDLAILDQAELIVLAAPVRQNLVLLEQLAAVIRGPAIITDTGSTKRDIVAAARALPERFTFIGGHPLGGAAVGGLEHARADLFRQRPWIFTPAETTPGETLDRLAAFAAALGSGVTMMTAADHDRIFAFLSHLPQLAASALMSVVGSGVGDEGLALAGRGLVDTTRLSSSPSDIWRDIAASNADQIGPALDLLIATLESLRRDLSAGQTLDTVFASAGRWREQLTSRSTL